MHRWTKWRTTGLVAAVLVVGLLAPTSASAHAKPASASAQLDRARTIRSGTTTVTTAPGVAKALLGASIAAFVTAPGTSSLIPTSDPKVVAKLPITGGSIGLKPPRGVIRHSGGLFLANLSNGKSVQVDKFIINLKTKQLTAHLVGTTARLPIFNLGLAKTVIKVSGRVVTISRVALRLTSTAASGLNSLLGTTVFTNNLLFGTASSRVVRR